MRSRGILLYLLSAPKCRTNMCLACQNSKHSSHGTFAIRLDTAISLASEILLANAHFATGEWNVEWKKPRFPLEPCGYIGCPTSTRLDKIILVLGNHCSAFSTTYRRHRA